MYYIVSALVSSIIWKKNTAIMENGNYLKWGEGSERACATLAYSQWSALKWHIILLVFI